jgi:hypothetical protein
VVVSVATTAYYFFRRFLYDRDRGVCGLCGDPVDFGPKMDIDHIVQLADGGSNDPSNLRITHSPCNRRRPRIQGIRTWIELPLSDLQALKAQAEAENFDLEPFLVHMLKRMAAERRPAADQPAP